jgi:hypothetical protein
MQHERQGVMLSLRSISRGVHMRLAGDGAAARQIPSTSLRAGSSGLKSLRMTPGARGLFRLGHRRSSPVFHVTGGCVTILVKAEELWTKP